MNLTYAEDFLLFMVAYGTCLAAFELRDIKTQLNTIINFLGLEDLKKSKEDK